MVVMIWRVQKSPKGHFCGVYLANWVAWTPSSRAHAHAHRFRNNNQQRAALDVFLLNLCARRFTPVSEPVVRMSHAGILHIQRICPPPFNACQANARTNPPNEPSDCFKTNLLVKSINHKLERHKATVFSFSVPAWTLITSRWSHNWHFNFPHSRENRVNWSACLCSLQVSAHLCMQSFSFQIKKRSKVIFISCWCSYG